ARSSGETGHPSLHVDRASTSAGTGPTEERKRASGGGGSASTVVRRRSESSGGVDAGRGVPAPSRGSGRVPSQAGGGPTPGGRLVLVLVLVLGVVGCVVVVVDEAAVVGGVGSGE